MTYYRLTSWEIAECPTESKKKTLLHVKCCWTRRERRSTKYVPSPNCFEEISAIVAGVIDRAAKDYTPTQNRSYIPHRREITEVRTERK